MSESCRDAIRVAGTALRHEAPQWAGEKWVAEENLHVTLCFIGEVAWQSVPTLAKAVGEQVERTACFTLPVAGITARPSLRRCRMLWCSLMDPEGDCGHLATRVRGACRPFGAPEDEHPFTPHVTVCRARAGHPISSEALSRADAALLGAADVMSVLRATLFSSRLTPRGPLYEELGTWHMWGA